MRFKSAFRNAALALCLSAGCTAAGWVVHARAADDQQTPSPDKGTTGQSNCIDETDDYQTHGRNITFVIGLTNKCDKRLRCEVFAYVISAKGPASGHAVLRLGPKSSGAGATKSYAMRVRMAGGSAQVARECRVF